MNNEFNNKKYILLVDDDPMVNAQNVKLLKNLNYIVEQVETLKEARYIIARIGMPCAIVLDVVLPDGNGIDFLRELRQTSNVPVLVLTTQNTQEDILNGLVAGGDHYLTKPYIPDLFARHVELLLRKNSESPKTLSLGPLSLELEAGKAFLNGEDLMLSQKEFVLLNQFVRFFGKLLLAEDLYVKIGGQDSPYDESTLNTALSRLGKKIAGSGYAISAECGGYIFRAD